MTISLAELLDALHTASAEPEDARSLNELCAEYGMTQSQMRKALHAMQAQGRLQVHQVTRIALDGRHGKVPAYTIKAKQ